MTTGSSNLKIALTVDHFVQHDGTDKRQRKSDRKRPDCVLNGIAKRLQEVCIAQNIYVIF